MTRISSVRLKYSNKALWFDAKDFDLKVGQAVVVLTQRGVELGRVCAETFDASKSDLDQLKSQLKQVLRIATEEDILQGHKMDKLGRDAMAAFREVAAKYSDEMNPVAVEYLLDGQKAIFYFESENRVDFRDIVKELAYKLHVRIDMRQIGVRDEARMIGGLGHCGQELCCSRMGCDVNPVSIKMAKEQGLSLNPEKISGLCGRLMCCLHYEYDAYVDFKKRAPKRNSEVKTPDGIGKVTDLDVPREKVYIQVSEDEKPVGIPLCKMKCSNSESRPSIVFDDAWDEAHGEKSLSLDVSALFNATNFSGADVLGEAVAVHRNTSKNASAEFAKGASHSGEQKAKAHKRKRRSVNVSSNNTASTNSRTQKHKSKSAKTSSRNVSSRSNTQSSTSQVAPQTHRKKRNRTHRTSGGINTK